jgi:hypothetical protein
LKRPSSEIGLRIFGQPVRIVTDDSSVQAIFSACYSAFLCPPIELKDSVFELAVRDRRSDAGWTVVHGDFHEDCEDIASLVYVVEKELTLELQRKRPDLFFLHGAALNANDRCVVIIGESGAGKSTLCWALCNAGLSYMSDELAPIDIDRMQVEPYPHAICLKKVAAGMPDLPARTIRTEATMHIPTEAIPSGVRKEPSRFGIVVFLKPADQHTQPTLVEMSNSEAAARFYANGLNQLAHEREGLAAAARLAAAGRCFSLARGDLNDMRDELLQLISPQSP